MAANILPLAGPVRVIGINEGQFFNIGGVDVAEMVANCGKRVIVTGLDQDQLEITFQPMPQLIAVAEYITKNLAICVKCGNPADKAQRKVGTGMNAPDWLKGFCWENWIFMKRAVGDVLRG